MEWPSKLSLRYKVSITSIWTPTIAHLVTSEWVSADYHLRHGYHITTMQTWHMSTCVFSAASHLLGTQHKKTQNLALILWSVRPCVKCGQIVDGACLAFEVSYWEKGLWQIDKSFISFSFSKVWTWRSTRQKRAVIRSPCLKHPCEAGIPKDQPTSLLDKLYCPKPPVQQAQWSHILVNLPPFPFELLYPVIHNH